MATPTYDLIDSTVLTGAATSVTFSSITQDYRDLVLVTYVVGSTSATRTYVRFNGDTGTNYNYVAARGNGSTASSYSGTNQSNLDTTVTGDGAEPGVFIRWQIFDYSATDKHKSVLIRADQADNIASMHAGRWADTSAINSIEIYTSSRNYVAGDSFYLYGIAS